MTHQALSPSTSHSMIRAFGHKPPLTPYQVLSSKSTPLLRRCWPSSCQMTIGSLRLLLISQLSLREGVRVGTPLRPLPPANWESISGRFSLFVFLLLLCTFKYLIIRFWAKRRPKILTGFDWALHNLGIARNVISSDLVQLWHGEDLENIQGFKNWMKSIPVMLCAL